MTSFLPPYLSRDPEDVPDVEDVTFDDCEPAVYTGPPITDPWNVTDLPVSF
jgi:hypothetical protein